LVIGRQFARDLQRPDLWQRPMHPGWLVLSGLLYLLGLGFSALYWYLLLGHLGPRPTRRAAIRAYYIGHFGKYLPGKAWALFLRATLIRSGGVSLGIAALTSFYEVLVTMASGVLLALGLFALLAPDTGASLTWQSILDLLHLQAPPGGLLDRQTTVLLSGLLLVPIGLPLLPPIFNRLIHHLSLPFRDPSATLPRFRFAYLIEGLLVTSFGWLLLGASLAAALNGILGADFPWTAAALGRLPAVMALSYVAGFVILLAPSGLGVREFFLTLLLTPELMTLGQIEEAPARAIAVLAVLVLRVVWTLAEVLLAAGLYWLADSTGEPPVAT
jgi:uncharacterized membrane protein YbhN (UPF0104 family)